MSKTLGYAVVQHSAFVGKGNPEFEAGLETRRLSTQSQVDLVRLAGGVVLPDYIQAEDYAEAAMYPKGHAGIIPDARGTFSKTRIDGMPIYIPAPAEPAQLSKVWILTIDDDHGIINSAHASEESATSGLRAYLVQCGQEVEDVKDGDLVEFATKFVVLYLDEYSVEGQPV